MEENATIENFYIKFKFESIYKVIIKILDSYYLALEKPDLFEKIGRLRRKEEKAPRCVIWQEEW